MKTIHMHASASHSSQWFRPLPAHFSARIAMGVAFLASAVTMPLAQAKLIEEIIKIPVQVSNSYGKESQQDIVVTLFHEDTAPTPYPVAVINHGRSAKAEQRAAFGRATYGTHARWLAQLGFLVVVPTRVGYGVTGGEDVEDSGSCHRKNYPPVYEAAAVQTQQVLQQVHQRPDVAKDRSIIIGQSFGGTTAITLAAKNPTGVQASINFAGGGGGNAETMPQEPCSPWALKDLFADYGKTARIPTLWIYTENDQWMGAKYPREWFDAFKEKGGVGEFVLFPPNGKDGHGLFSNAPDVWRATVLAFLRASGYPDLTMLQGKK